MTTQGGPAAPSHGAPALPDALARLRSAIAAMAYPLDLPSAEEAQAVGSGLIAQLDDYLLPRLVRLDAPLLVVVGGSTGAGKSTLVNSLVRARVSATGVLRPTTRSPVLVSHPADAAWFRQGDLLPGLTRTAGPTDAPDSLQLVSAPALPPGLAFLDAPDIDSVVDANRALAVQLLAAADLWLFVTTAARYADAVPWQLLQTAQLRGTMIALALDRVPPEAIAEITDHLQEMLTGHDLGEVPIFVVPETLVDGQGLLPELATAQLREWFGRLAGDSTARAAVVRQTLDGALSALGPAVDGLAAADDDQLAAARSLTDRVRSAYRGATRHAEQAVQDGRLLRGEVLGRWQDFVGTGELFRSMEARVGRVRDRIVSAVTGRPAPASQLRTAIESQLVTVIRGAAAEAAETAQLGWRAHPAGAALLTAELGYPSADLPQRAERLVREWQRDVLELVRAEAGDKRFVARTAAYAVNATGLAVMIAVFASTAFIPTGLEVAAAGGTTVAAQKVLEAIFGDQAIRSLANRSRAGLLHRIRALLDEEADRYLRLIGATGIAAESVETDAETPGDRLRIAAVEVEQARTAANLSSGTPYQLPGTGPTAPGQDAVTPGSTDPMPPVSADLMPPAAGTAGPLAGPAGPPPGAVA
ncbi:ABC transporter [Micromonospora sp. LOL_023]|uniref:ABC transporter n=1 Tax=Micromonospora sp. LOL_023 TaxID=3345418 RepID=UPI003A879258